MKKLINIFALLFLIIGMATGQGVPKAFKYQAVLRHADGSIVSNMPVELRITIKADPDMVYIETHTTTTNSFGLVILDIGWGTILDGDFSTIDWAVADHFMTVEVSIAGHPFVDMGTTQLLSVPYAFLAGKSVEGDADDDPNNELNSAVDFDGTELSITDAGGTIPVDLSSLEESAEAAAAQAVAIAAQAAIDDHVLADEDLDDTNEIELPPGGDNGQVLSTNGAGNYSWIDKGEAPTTYAIGDLAHGGIVFYVNAEGTHGLVAANIDQYSGPINYIDWWQAHRHLNNPSKHDEDGAKYFNWRLPTKWELSQMWSNLYVAGLGGLATDTFYWSSSEYNVDRAWAAIFTVTNYGGNPVYKDVRYGFVRAVRPF